jgi:hypothetical protein
MTFFECGVCLRARSRSPNSVLGGVSKTGISYSGKNCLRRRSWGSIRRAPFCFLSSGSAELGGCGVASVVWMLGSITSGVANRVLFCDVDGFVLTAGAGVTSIMGSS